MGVIVKEVLDVLRDIRDNGYSVNRTRELQNTILEIYLNEIDIVGEEKEIEELYNTYIESYTDRQALEKTHYDRLNADFIHELTRHQWFTNHDKIYGIEELIAGLKYKLPADVIDKINDQKEHMITEMKKLDNFSGRRNIIFSHDCVSFIQLLVRDKGNVMNVVIRSSDAFKLLPIDILEMIKLYYTGTKTLNIKTTNNDKIVFLITSCHTYDSDANKIKYLLKWSE